MEKQIEEMLDIMVQCEQCSKYNYYTCSGCVHRDENRAYAKLLYEQGYRKIPQDAVVLTKKEYGAINLEKATDMLRAIQDQARKETAKEVLQRFYAYTPPKEKGSFEIKTSSFEDVEKVVRLFRNCLNDDIREFAKQYGVEIEQ